MMLGYCYDNGIGTSVNKQKAFELYQKAADNAAQYNLALKYKKGEYVDKDHDKAFELFKKSAEGEYLEGILQLGNWHGIGTNIDMQKAFELYQKAADLDSTSGINNLGYCYQHGILSKYTLNSLLKLQLFIKK